MALRRLCKSADSVGQHNCPAMYVDDADPTAMVGQGLLLDVEMTNQLLALAVDEAGVAIPTETVLRAAGLFLAERGHPAALAEVKAYLAEGDL